MIVHRRSLLVAFGAASLASFFAPELCADQVDEALARVTKARASLKTLQAPFKQRRIIGLLATEVVSKGKLTLVRPDRLRWELSPPDAVTYWIGPEGLAMKSDGGVHKMGKAAAGRFGAVLGDLLIMLGGDMQKLRKRYHLEVKDADRLSLIAKPKAKDVAKHVEKLRLQAGEEPWQVRRIEIHEKNGDQSIIDFGAFLRDKAVDPAVMKPPKK